MGDKLGKLIAQSMAIEVEEAKQAGAVGFMARALTQATMPHKATPGCEFKRRNGSFSLTMLSPSDIGLPYGSIPRLLLSWMTTEAVRTKSPILELGPSLSAFMAELDLMPTGGRWGTITRLREQMKRLFSCTVSCDYADQTMDAGEGYRITKSYKLWWDTKSPSQVPLWKSTVTLSTDFFQEIIERPVPIDMRALKALKRSPLALDIYCWLTYRLSYLRKPAEIPWPALQMQFGADRPRRNRSCSRCRSMKGTPGRTCEPSPMNMPKEPRRGGTCTNSNGNGANGSTRKDRHKNRMPLLSRSVGRKLSEKIHRAVQNFNDGTKCVLLSDVAPHAARNQLKAHGAQNPNMGQKEAD